MSLGCAAPCQAPATFNVGTFAWVWWKHDKRYLRSYMPVIHNASSLDIPARTGVNIPALNNSIPVCPRWILPCTSPP